MEAVQVGHVDTLVLRQGAGWESKVQQLLPIFILYAPFQQTLAETDMYSPLHLWVDFMYDGIIETAYMLYHTLWYWSVVVVGSRWTGSKHT